MSCSSAIYTVNSSNTVLAANSTIPVGSTIRRFGPGISQDGNAITLHGSGYYECNCSISIAPTMAMPITVQLYQDGVAIPGAVATTTPSAANAVVNLNITSLIRVCGCNCTNVITARVNSASTLNNMSIVIEKE